MNERTSILVVEDDPDIRELLSELLEEEGYEVKVAADGREALDELDHWSPSVMLLDLMMPRVSGFELLERLSNKELPHPPGSIIVLSASGVAADEVLRHPVRLLRKPFKVDQLLSEVSHAVAH